MRGPARSNSDTHALEDTTPDLIAYSTVSYNPSTMRSVVVFGKDG